MVLNKVSRESVVSVGKDNIAHMLNQQYLKPVVDLYANIDTREVI
jgi:hypothetical protein